MSKANKRTHTDRLTNTRSRRTVSQMHAGSGVVRKKENLLIICEHVTCTIRRNISILYSLYRHYFGNKFSSFDGMILVFAICTSNMRDGSNAIGSWIERDNRVSCDCCLLQLWKHLTCNISALGTAASCDSPFWYLCPNLISVLHIWGICMGMPLTYWLKLPAETFLCILTRSMPSACM